MSGDYTRSTHRPRKRYTSVAMQQGRVQLDSDWNEQVDIERSRWQTQAKDTMGPAAVPKETTPDGFKVMNLGGGNFQLGVGRMYVDGLLAEIFDGETFTYTNQKFFPNPPPLPASGGAIVVLDVWEREVTYLEDPELLDVALSGVDTSTRVQTIWQVRVAASADAKCGLPLGGLFPASSGTLTTSVVTPPPADNCCIVDPSGGYRGLENRLYRVEVVEGGAAGTAKFVWSRENASIATSVEKINAAGTEITVRRIGRDQVLRFANNDLIEIIDDTREFKSTLPRIFRTVTVQEATRTLLPNTPVNALGFDPNADPSTHVRIKKWECGAVLTTAADVDIGDGIHLSFAGGTFLAGDYWLFAARTADASIELLDHAPPRGITHHFAQLAAIPDVTGTTVHDCRPLWPHAEGCCCCSVEVGPEGSDAKFRTVAEALAWVDDNIQETTPVRICLLPGVHEWSEPAVINRDRVTIAGCPRLTRVHSEHDAFHIDADHVTIEDVSMRCDQDSIAVVISDNRFDVRVQRCEIAALNGVQCNGATNARFEDNVVAAAIAFAVRGTNVLIARNEIEATFGGIDLDLAGVIDIRSDARLITIRDNTIHGDHNGNLHGIAINAEKDSKQLELDEITIERNDIRGVGGCGIFGFSASSSKEIAAAIEDLVIRDNVITDCDLEGEDEGGKAAAIFISGAAHLLIAGNEIVDNGIEQKNGIAGILVNGCAGLIVRDNVITGNGNTATSPQQKSGGIICTKLRVVVEAQMLAKDVIVKIKPDGWPAALIEGNVVVTPIGQALYLHGLGPMLVRHNELTSHRAVDTVAGVVEIMNLGLPAYMTRQTLAFGYETRTLATTSNGHISDFFTIGGKVDFTDNYVELDLIEGAQDVLPSAVAIVTLDDLAFHNNQVDCTFEFGVDAFLTNVLLFGLTMRATGNGMTESPFMLPGSTLLPFSLIGLSLLLCTGTSNQGTHCIVFVRGNDLPPVPPFGAAALNVELMCGLDRRNLIIGGNQ